ncbi:MAG: DUF2163 domain-containing protein [Alphaproteobacteria bacterium]|nr:DUF2163 domain-containing protein [Alphaproteobacteria bacterium]
MRAIPPTLQTKLNSGVTMLCRCWRIVRRDGEVLGFTDHDEDVSLDALVCRAGTGLTGSEATARLGLSVAGSEISGALDGEVLNEADLAAGRYDAASIEVYLVDWSEPELNVLLTRGTLGEVRREGAAFAAEVRSLADKLNEERGRRYTAACSADLGDARCAIVLSALAFTGAGAIETLRGTSSLIASGLDAYADGWFTGGRLQWTSGGNVGLAIEVKSHRVTDDGAVLDLWQAMPEPLSEGDAFAVTAGCDKRFVTCRDRFDNAANFRGFPHIPGNDFVARYAVSGEPGNTGKSLQG